MSDEKTAQTLTWRRDASGNLSSDNLATIEAVKTLVKSKERKSLKAQLKSWTPEDVVDLLVHLPLKHARRLFSLMEIGPSTKVLSELKPEFRAVITEDATIERLREILDRLPADKASETLEALPDDVQERLSTQLKHTDKVAEILAHAKDTAGRVMSRRLLALPPDCTVETAISEIRRHAETIRKLDDIYVIDSEHRPLGAISTKRLFLLPGEMQLGDAMRHLITVVSADMDQEEVGRIAARKDLRAVPVVDQTGRLIGQITVRQLQKIIYDEATEDLRYMSKLPADAKPTDPIWRIVRGRLPWLMAGLIGATIAAMVVGSYETELERAAILAAFIPVVMSLAGNAGLQASAVTVQALATRSIWARDLVWRFVRELGGALINGAAVSLILALLILIAGQFFDISETHRLSMAVSLSLLTVITIAALVGAFVPMALDRIGVDPAIATGVFITTSNDVLGVLIFFWMATEFYFK